VISELELLYVTMYSVICELDKGDDCCRVELLLLAPTVLDAGASVQPATVQVQV
jgi:hypothetical protein